MSAARLVSMVSVATCVAACSHARPVASGPAPVAMVSSRPGVAAVAPGAGPLALLAAPAPIGGRLTLPQARRYMWKLVNRDRASAGLPPIALDESAAQRAGQAHAEDMARSGYLGHWGTDGSVPEQRFTEAGGSDMDMENASCFTDERSRTLDSSPGIDPRSVEQTEAMFFNERPPHDGHRQNILKAWHTAVGIGVAQPVATATEIPVPCFSQEFIDDYGTYAALPARVRVGATLHVEGTLAPPATFAGVGLARMEAPRPLPVAELNKRRSYPVPTPYQMYWPPGFQTPIAVKVAGSRFTIDIPVSDGGKPGLYELSIWATVPGAADLTMIGLRTFAVR